MWGSRRVLNNLILWEKDDIDLCNLELWRHGILDAMGRNERLALTAASSGVFLICPLIIMLH